MIRTVNIANEKGIKNFCNVHDSFATHACDVDKLNESIREAFVGIFSQDLLTEFKKDALQLIPDDKKEQATARFPARPTDGDLDLSLLHECKYFFA